MSCYLRHMGGILKQAGATPANKAERRRVDRTVREIVGQPEAKCPEVWKEVKKLLQEPDGEARLVDSLRKALVGAGEPGQ